MKITVLFDVTPYILVDRYQRFGGISCLLFQDRRESHIEMGSNTFKRGRRTLSVSHPTAEIAFCHGIMPV
jgi:hypothetical protein